MVRDLKNNEYRVLTTSFLVDLLDVVLNLTVALTTGSVVMISETFQGLADLTATGFLLVGYKRSRKRADKLHPFGHGKEIYFWTLISAVVMMTITASASFYVGLLRFFHPQEIVHIEFGFIVLTVALVTNGYAFFLSLRRLLEDNPIRNLLNVFLQSSAVATKNAFVLDAMGFGTACFGLVSLVLSHVFHETKFDGIGAMVIGVTTALLALMLIIGVKGFLIGKRASLEDEQKIREAVLTIPQVTEILDLRTMQLGSEKLLVNLEVHMKDNLTTNQLENLMDKVKSSVKSRVPSVQHIQVELETPRSV